MHQRQTACRLKGEGMRKVHLVILFLVLIAGGIAGWLIFLQPPEDIPSPAQSGGSIKLPEPKYDSETSIEQALLKRRSVRSYTDQPLTLAELSQILWAAQGVTDEQRGYRTAPSAGALYPLEVYTVVENVEGVTQGVYQYKPQQHELVLVKSGSVREQLTNAALGQSSVGESPVVVVISAVYERTTKKYGERGVRYVHMEAGHAAQNMYLQAVSLNLGMVVIGAFDEDEVKKILNMPDQEQPLYIIPLGRSA